MRALMLIVSVVFAVAGRPFTVAGSNSQLSIVRCRNPASFASNTGSISIFAGLPSGVISSGTTAIVRAERSVSSAPNTGIVTATAIRKANHLVDRIRTLLFDWD